MAQQRSTAWAFANLGQDTSKTVWEIGEAYRKKYQGGKVRHGHTHPTQLLKYFYFNFLTGARPQEPIIEPEPVINFSSKGNEIWVEVTKVNEKHFKNAVALNKDEAPKGYRQRRKLDLVKSTRDTTEQAFPVFNEYEQKMWIFLTDGGVLMRGSEIFQFKEWKSTKKKNITCLFKTNFRTDLRDLHGRVHRDSGITPYILRHMRAYNLIVNYGADISWVVKVFGWANDSMLYRYADIRRNLSIRGQLEILRRTNMLTTLSVDVAKAMP